MIDLKTLAILSLGLGLGACTGEEPSDTSTPEETDTEEKETGEPAPDLEEIVYFTVFGSFGLKDGKATSFKDTLSGLTQDIPPSIAVILANDNFLSSGSMQNDSCLIGFEAAGDIDAAAWSSSATGVLFGISTDQLVMTEENCSDGWDIEAIGGVAAFEDGDYVLGMGVEAAVDSSVQTILENANAWADLNGLVAGSGVYFSGANGAQYADGSGLTEGFEVDADYKVQKDDKGESVRIPTAEYAATRNGAYISSALTVFDINML